MDSSSGVNDCRRWFCISYTAANRPYCYTEKMDYIALLVDYVTPCTYIYAVPLRNTLNHLIIEPGRYPCVPGESWIRPRRILDQKEEQEIS